MAVYFARRLALAVPIILIVIFITYALAIYGPGDPITTLIGQTEMRDDEVLKARLRHEYGFDRPFLVQYADYVKNFVAGDWGTSFQLQDQSVRALVLRAIPVSVQLGVAAFGLLLLIGIPLGVWAGVRAGSWLDRAILAVAIVADSIPAFVLAPIALVVFVLKLDLIDSAIGWDGLFSQKAILPAFILAIGPMLIIVRQTRYAVAETLQQDYVRTARAKGLRPRAVVWRHVCRNALQPVVTLSGMIAAYMVTGSIFVEQIFGIPGFGQLVVRGLQRNDLPLLMATTIIGAVFVIVANLVVDVLYALLDPRIRLSH